MAFRASRLAAAALNTSGVAAFGLATTWRGQAQCSGEPHAQSFEARLSTSLAAMATGASVMAAAAPALCAVHCAAMPVAAVLLPSLQAVGGGKLFGGVCMHKVGRRLAFYFVIPLGLVSNAVGYPKHQSPAVTATSLMGISAVTAGAAWSAVAPYRLFVNLSGCAMMLGATYYGNRLESENGRGCGHCCDGH